jgi:hypothetical protein
MAEGQASVAPAGTTPQRTPDEWSEEAAIRDRFNLLRDHVHMTLHGEFRNAADDLEQLRGLLNDAAQKLAGAFSVIAGGTVRLVSLAEEGTGGAGSGARSELVEIAREITSKTGTTVQSLQFEDMASQLLQHVRRRLAMLEAFSKDMAVLYPNPPGGPLPQGHETLDRLFELLEKHRAMLSGAQHKQVQQQNMDSGDIELF